MIYIDSLTFTDASFLPSGFASLSVTEQFGDLFSTDFVSTAIIFLLALALFETLFQFFRGRQWT